MMGVAFAEEERIVVKSMKVRPWDQILVCYLLCVFSQVVALSVSLFPCM